MSTPTSSQPQVQPAAAAATTTSTASPSATATPTATPTPLNATPPKPTATPTSTVPPGTPVVTTPAPVLTDLKPLANELLKLVNNYLTVSPLILNILSATLPTVRDRLQGDINPYNGNKAELSWAIREAIRSEFAKVLYPAPPPPVLLLLLFGTEIILTNMYNPSRPFYFPGARVTAPTSDGSRRIGTTLQLRSKTVQGGPVMEAMLHLDGPHGGTFQWIQVKSLQPASGTTLPTAAEAGVSLPTGRRGSNRRGARRTRGGRTNRGNRAGLTASGRRVRARPTPETIATSNGSLPPLPGSFATNGGGLSAQPIAPAPAAGNTTPSTNSPTVGIGIAAAATTTSRGSGGNKNSGSTRNSAVVQIAQTAAAAIRPPRPAVANRPSRPSAANTSSSVANGGGGRSSGSGSSRGGPTVEPAAAVPTSLVCALPPPRPRIVGDGRPISHSSGSLRRAFDVNASSSIAQSAAKLKLILGIERLLARRMVENVGVQYFVIWSGRPVKDGSWESRESLLEDVPGLVREFDIRHPEESTAVRLPPKRDATKTAEASEATGNSFKGSSADRAQTGDGNGAKESISEAKNRKEGTEKNRLESENDQSNVKGDSGKKEKKKIDYVDDVSGMKIPSWVDTPIVELNISGMVLQIRRPDDYSLHNDAEAAARDGKRRQAEFKKKNIETAVHVYSLSRPEARSAIDHGLRAHRERGQRAIQFPRGLGRVSAGDLGIPFAKRDALMAPPSWDAYLIHLGMKCSDVTRDLPPWMPTADKEMMDDIIDAHNDQKLTNANEHRERARRLVREAFRYDGLVTPPAKLFRDGVRVPPGVPIAGSSDQQGYKQKTEYELANSGAGRKRTRVSQADNVHEAEKANDDGDETALKISRVGDGKKNGGGESEGLLRNREEKVLEVLNEIKQNPKGQKATQNGKQDDEDGMWFDAVWACWRRTPASSSST